MKLWNSVRNFGLALVLSAGSSAAFAVDDLAFEQDVADAIDDGLQYLRNISAFTNSGQYRGLVLLALLEKRASIDPDAAILGYVNSSPADKALAEQAAGLIINDSTYGGSRAVGTMYAYGQGQSLMALSLYANTGGPEPAGANKTLRAAIDRMTDGLIAGQSPAGSGEEGHWGYFGNGQDSSTTQFAAAGLAAAKAFYARNVDGVGDPGSRQAAIDTALALTAKGYEDGANADGGEGYQTRSPFYTSSYQQTASGLWASLLGGKTLNDQAVQDKLNWLRDNYNYQTIYAAYNSWPRSYYYYLWSSAKAYTLLDDSGLTPNPGNIGPDNIGDLAGAAITKDRADFRLAHRDFTTDEDARVGGNPGKYATYLDDQQKPLWYYDYAYSLMTQQGADGRFTASSFRNNGDTVYNHGCWNNTVCQAYAILVLQRAVGGVCVDSDGDGVCDDEDNCVQTPNPNQEDADNDGVGDVCDNCVNTPNPGQEDDDNNGVGNACEVVGGIPCDIDGDDDVDRNDIRAITAARNTAALPGDPRDNDGNGTINVNDARQCVLLCTLPRCAVP